MKKQMRNGTLRPNLFLLAACLAWSACGGGGGLKTAQTSAPARSETASAPAKQTEPAPPPAGWALYPKPSDESPEMRCANYSSREWRVSQAADGVFGIDLTDGNQRTTDPLPFVLKPERGLAGERHVARVEDGWLVGFDAGEFGGGLWWFSDEGDRRQKLSEENIVGFAPSPKGVLAAAGLAHGGFESGKILRVGEGGEGRRAVETLVDLGHAPSALASESPDAIIVVTTGGVVRVRTSGEVEHLARAPLDLLYPNSLTLSPSGVVHVGMRHFVVRLTPSGDGYREEWFVPEGCRNFEQRGLDCVCLHA